MLWLSIRASCWQISAWAGGFQRCWCCGELCLGPQLPTFAVVLSRFFLFVWDGGGTRKILEVIKKITPISLAGCWWLVIGCWACVLCQYWRWCCWSWMLSWHHSRQPRWGRRNTVNQVIRGCAVFLSCNSLGIATSSVSHSIPKFTAERNYH